MLSMELSDDDAEEFGEVQNTLLVMLVLPRPAVEALATKLGMPRCRAFRAKMMPRYIEALRPIKPEGCDSEDDLRFLASAVFDALSAPHPAHTQRSTRPQPEPPAASATHALAAPHAFRGQCSPVDSRSPPSSAVHSPPPTLPPPPR